MEEEKIILLITFCASILALILAFAALRKAKRASSDTDRKRIADIANKAVDRQFDFYFNQKVRKMIREEIIVEQDRLARIAKQNEPKAPIEKKSESKPVKVNTPAPKPVEVVQETKQEVKEEIKEANNPITLYTGSYFTGKFRVVTTIPDDKTIFTINAESEEAVEGVLDIDRNAYNKVAQTPDFIENACNLSGSGTQLKVIKKGVVIKENGEWVVKEPIIAELN